MKKIFLIIFSILLINSVEAADSFATTTISFQVSALNPMDKLDLILSSPEGLLNRFKPGGATITDKKVSHAQVTFNATKTYLFVRQTVFVNGVFNANPNKGGCSALEEGSDITFSFAGSDGLLFENIDRIEIKLCTKETKKNTLNINLKARLIRGRHYSPITGPFVKNIIEAQVNALINSLREEMGAI